jgi:hypothetical protein
VTVGVLVPIVDGLVSSARFKVGPVSVSSSGVDASHVWTAVTVGVLVPILNGLVSSARFKVGPVSVSQGPSVPHLSTAGLCRLAGAGAVPAVLPRFVAPRPTWLHLGYCEFRETREALVKVLAFAARRHCQSSSKATAVPAG